MINDTIESIKELTTTWQVAIFAALFCLWPLSAALIFLHDPELFKQLDILKLTLLSSAISTPFLSINCFLAFYILRPEREELRRLPKERAQSTSVALGIYLTTIVLSVACVYLFFNSGSSDPDYHKKNAMIISGIIEFVIVVISLITIFKERS